MKSATAPLWVPLLLGLVIALLGAGGAYGYTRYEDLETSFASSTERYDAQIAVLNAKLKEAEQTNEELHSGLTTEKSKNDAFAKEIGEISGTVKVLDKLAKTDPELLAKYSKVFFLNENYAPPRLATIPKSMTYDESRTFEFHADAIDHLKDMIEDAEDDDVKLYVASAFRSFDEQAGLKSGYRITYGAGANAFSADQGYSEHQLGTTVDFTTTGIGGGLVTAFDTTPAYEWLTKNAHKYGFVLSYPKGNAYYIYEPWHWRYVGVELAEDLDDDGKHFYDLDQREIDEYLVSIFD